MKKFILTSGLFSLMLVLTSFTSPVEIGGPGNQGAPRSMDIVEIGKPIGGPGNQGAPRSMDIEIGKPGGPGNQGAPRSMDIEIGKPGGPGNQGAPRA